MINNSLINPRHIVVIGASNDLHKPGGKILHNILSGTFRGEMHVINPHEEFVQGVQCFSNIESIASNEIDLGILAISSKFCLDAVKKLIELKSTKAFIIISAGFSEKDQEGKELEEEIVRIANENSVCLVGPNCIGVLSPYYQGIFTSPIPELSAKGCDLASSSGATAMFIIESGRPKGLKFASLFSIGNGAQTSIEDIVKYWDETYVHGQSPKVKLLYIESITKPDILLKHASALVRKGAKIAAIKAGQTIEGSRAASSHTGAMANPDIAVDALFRKAGIVRCIGREELITVACLFMHKELNGKNIAIITHAGGPAVMLTDALEAGGIHIPKIDEKDCFLLREMLLPGASVQNPIDLLATGTASHLGQVIDFCDEKLNQIHAIVVIFGSTGLQPVFDAYKILNEKIHQCSKPIFAILPSLSSAKEETELFMAEGNINFPDEVLLAKGIARIHHTPKPQYKDQIPLSTNIEGIRNLINSYSDGWLSQFQIRELLKVADIPYIEEYIVTNRKEALEAAEKTGFPLVMKVCGILHKTEVSGVILNIITKQGVEESFQKLIQIKGAIAVLMQPMLKGIDLFIGAKYEKDFGHIVLCGLGGIFVEVLKDIKSALAPLQKAEALHMIHSLKSYPLFKGFRGNQPVNENLFAEIMVKVAALGRIATEIAEMDFNPLIAFNNNILCADVRIRIQG